MALGLNLEVLIGKQSPKSVSRELIEAIQTVEVTLTDQGRSGFQIVFHVGRRDRQDLKDYRLVTDPLLQVYNRVILVVSLGTSKQVLIDGVITHQQLSPSTAPGQSTFTLTGEDLSRMMDLEEKSQAHPAQDEATIAQQIIADYAKFGVKADVVKPKLIDRPTQDERIPFQLGTDLDYLQQIGHRFAHVFYIMPGKVPGRSTAYWGPPKRDRQEQKTLTVNMGSFTNVKTINFQNDATVATAIEGLVQDRRTNQINPVNERQSDRKSLAQKSALSAQRHFRVRQFRQTGLLVAQAQSRAQAMADKSVDDVITATGEVDTISYGDFLKLRGLVGLRGVGKQYDGLYYVKRVTHHLSPGAYKQQFTITRDGLGSTVSKVSV